MVVIVQLRCGFRLCPNGPQRAAPARTFGRARITFNDALRVREYAPAPLAWLPAAESKGEEEPCR
ncbi:helix-turn-helix domain-containing protein [Streptomyces noursei]|uniref:helix-turn-helix domain-containing protein n=1 Tax=Streptomyces noursei TaxID=1971 RepID=UPI0033DE994B